MPEKHVVILESPYAGDIDTNIRYARECLRDSILRNEIPLASHLLYTQDGVLDDNDPTERQLGIELGLSMGKLASMTVVYIDLGVSSGMKYGIQRALDENRPVEYRKIR